MNTNGVTDDQTAQGPATADEPTMPMTELPAETGAEETGIAEDAVDGAAPADL